MITEGTQNPHGKSLAKPLGSMTPSTLNRTGFPQNSKKRAFYSPSSSASSTPRCHHTPNKPYCGLSADTEITGDLLEDAASSSPFAPSNQTAPFDHRNSRYRATLKRSFGFLNLSLETSPTVRPTIKRLPHTVGKSLDEEFSEDAYSTSVPTHGTGSFIKPPKKKSSKTSVATSSHFINPNKAKSMKKMSSNSTNFSWKRLFNSAVGDDRTNFDNDRHKQSKSEEHYDKFHPFNPTPDAPFLSPQSIPNSSFNKESQDFPSKQTSIARKLDRQTGPLDRTPFTNPADAFITPASFNCVKPLQTAFTSTGLQSKKTLTASRSKTMPETPCKRPPHTIVDVNGSFAGMNTSFNSTLTGVNVNVDSNTTGIGFTPNSVKPLRLHSSGGSSSSGGSRTATRPERAVNTTDLQSCILRFTNEFDDLYSDGNNSSTSIFTEGEQHGQGSLEQQPISNEVLMESSPVQNEDVRMDEDIDLDKIDEIQFEGFGSNFGSYDNLPPTPTRLGNSSGHQEQQKSQEPQEQMKFQPPQFPRGMLTPTKSHSSYWRRASSSENTMALPNMQPDLALSRKPSFRRHPSSCMPSTLSLPPTTPILSETAPRTPVECAMNLSQQSAAYNPKSLTATMVFNETNKDNEDPCIRSRFGNCKLVGSGEFSVVYETQYENFKYAVKRTKRPIAGPKTRMRKLEEVEILRTLHKPERSGRTSRGEDDSENTDEGKEYVLSLVDYWEYNSYLYILTEFCENGSLERFLAESGKISRLDEWRVWKIMVEMLLGVQYIHKCGILHLDLKPANILITFEGSLKIGDFGVASQLPIPPFFDREGDREYIAPEVISRHVYGKAADIFSCGLIMVEIAANIILPDNGTSWQKLRSGDLTDAGKLSSSDLTDLEGSVFSSTTNTYSSNLTSDPGQLQNTSTSTTTSATSATSTSESKSRVFLTGNRGSVNNNGIASNESSSLCRYPSWAPKWFLDGSAPLDKVVAWMIDPNPGNRPSASQVLKSYECSVVDLRRKSGATIYEGDYGPQIMAEDSEILAAEEVLQNTRYKLSKMT
ncbi:hypothetical protein FOA43_003807 [Brettanomyces nanus]|uniref:Protein kinase domain-containing protein n=1 Tax=Eeniella nana TaxID=13502 RepID=A0A875S649_EENNA|nr:uncharacterized protein FOA43_003807 [Brettanomyces nanus]QPG76418.1 hypothetical protein FOA43_003807 [Brettanomyces nanus]